MPLDSASVITEVLKERASRKPRKARKAKKARKARKPRVPKLHRPKKESTKTITTRLYKTWAAVVHAYHGNKCAVCGRENSKDAPLNAHHIMPRQMFSGLRFDPWNGVSLCPKCHKMGKFSAHKGGIWFAEFLRAFYPVKYEYCIKHKDDELDCKDRMRLYVAEEDLHERYSDAISPISHYKIVAYDKKGNKVESVIKAYNNRAAEYIFWQRWPAGQEGFEKLKGIHKTEQVYVESDETDNDFDADRVVDAVRESIRDNDGRVFKSLLDGLDAMNGMVPDPKNADEAKKIADEVFVKEHGLPAEDVEKLRKDLVGRGLVDEDGNAIYHQQTPTIADAAKMAIVQNAMDKQFQP